MNDIAKKATADKFLRALEKEQLSKAEAGACIGVTPGQVSCYFNEKYWAKLGIIYWDKLLAWANSGQSLKEYSEKHGKVLPVEKKKIIDPEFKPVDFTPEMKDKIETAEKLSKHPYFSGAKEPPQRLSAGEMVDLLLEEKKFLQCKIDAIDVLLKHYIS